MSTISTTPTQADGSTLVRIRVSDPNLGEVEVLVHAGQLSRTLARGMPVECEVTRIQQ